VWWGSLCGVREEQRSGPKAQAQSGGGRAAYLFRPCKDAARLTFAQKCNPS